MLKSMKSKVKYLILIEVEGKIPNINNLATTSSVTAVENKIPSVRNLKVNNRKFCFNIKTSKISKQK